MTYHIMRHHPDTWTDPGEDECLSEHTSREYAEEYLAALREKHPLWSLWLAKATGATT